MPKLLSSVWIWIRDFFNEGDDLLLVKVGGRRCVTNTIDWEYSSNLSLMSISSYVEYETGNIYIKLVKCGQYALKENK